MESAACTSSRLCSMASTIPRIALEYFSDRFLRPKYGNAVGLDSTFHLPSRIDSAIVGTDQVTITQR